MVGNRAVSSTERAVRGCAGYCITDPLQRILVVMTRTLAVVWSAFALVACDVGSVLVGRNGPDGGSGDGNNVKMDGGGNGCIPLVAAANTPDRHHPGSENCPQVRCHLTGQTGIGAP